MPMPKGTIFDTTTKNVDRIFRVLNRSKKIRNRTFAEILEKTGLDFGQAKYAMKRAIAEGLVKRSGFGRNTTYVAVP